MRDLHRDFLVLTEEQRRIVAAVIDQRVMQAAIARAWIERDIRKTIMFDQVDDNVGLPSALGIASRRRFVPCLVHRVGAITLEAQLCLGRGVDRGAHALIGAAAADIGDGRIDIGIRRLRLVA